MGIRKTCVTVIFVLAGLVDAIHLVAQDGYFQYPPYGAWRGRMVYRDGLWHSERYRWGGGLTATGGAVLTDAVQVASTLAGGRDAATREPASNRRSMSSNSDHAGAVSRSNYLINRAEQVLAKGMPPLNRTTPTTPSVSAQSNGPVSDVEALRKLYQAPSSTFEFKTNP